jgi:hypothetical protein
MTIDKFESTKERKLVTLLIMNEEFCRCVINGVNPRQLKTPYSTHVVTWVKEYFVNYGTCPATSIQDIWETKKKVLNDDELSESIATFLGNLADDYDPADYKDIKYHIEDCELYIRDLELERLEEQVHAKRMSGKVDEAEAAVANFKRGASLKAVGVSLINDIDVYEKSFSEETMEPLFSFKGDLGKITPPLYRGDFFAVLSITKGGKSFALQHVGDCALEAGNTVLMINLEMREDAFHQRLWRCINMAPMVSGYYNVPQFTPDIEPGKEPDENTMYRITNRTIYRDAVSFKDKEGIQNTLKMRYRGGDIVQLTLPAHNTTINDIEAILDNYEYYNNKKFDVIIIDYADLLGGFEREEFRHRVNQIWLNLRRMAQERNVCMCTVSQSNADGIDGKAITLAALAEDKRKATHVTAMMALYGTDEERNEGRVRMKCLVSRDKTEGFGEVTVLQQLDLGQFYIDSKFSNKING